MTLASMKLRLRALFRRERVEQELDAEMAHHLELETAAGVRAGLSAAEARRQALLKFGGAERWTEAHRDVRGVRVLEDASQDVRYALRSLRRAPAFTAVAVLTLALGIGANTAIFSVVDAVLLRPLPYASPDELVMVWQNDRGSGTEREAASPQDYFDYQTRARTLEFAAFLTGENSMTREGGDPERVVVTSVSHNLFELLGVRPLLGRDIDAENDVPGAARVAVLSEELWRGAFGADPAILGKVIVLDDVAHTVAGVMPANVNFPDGGTQIWAPFQLGPETASRYNHFVSVVGRLLPGAELPAAQREMVGIMDALEEEYPESNTNRGAFIEPLAEATFGSIRQPLVVLLSAVALVLLIACVNVASLLLARATGRTREVAVRAAIGASQLRLARQFVTESIVLAGVGALMGLALSWLMLQQLMALAPSDLPRADAIGLHPRVLAFTLGLSLLVAMAFSLLPLWHARRVDLQSTLKSEGRSGTAGVTKQRLRAGLVVVELALAVALLIGAGLLMRSFVGLRGVDPGFRAEGVVKFDFSLPTARYPRDFSQWPNWEAHQRMQRETLERVGNLPGVQAVAVASNNPMNEGFTNSFLIVGREAEDHPEIRTRMVTANYFSTVGVPLLRGRALNEGDAAGAPFVAVINQAAEQAYFPEGNAVGQQIRFWGTDWNIVGVVGNERFQGLAAETPPAIYGPLMQAPMQGGSILVRGGNTDQIVPAVIAQVRAIDPALALYDIEPLTETVNASMAQQRFTTTLLVLFAFAAVLLALIGVHGLLSYTVAQRSQELGIRMALGATRNEVLTMIIGGGLRLALLGTAVGVVGALAASRLAESLLFGVSATDIPTYAGAVIVLLLTAVIASWLPARRATAINPITAMREF